VPASASLHLLVLRPLELVRSSTSSFFRLGGPLGAPLDFGAPVDSLVALFCRFRRGILSGRLAQGFFISNNATRACLSMASAGGTPEQAGEISVRQDSGGPPHTLLGEKCARAPLPKGLRNSWAPQLSQANRQPARDTRPCRSAGGTPLPRRLPDRDMPN